MDQSLGNDDVDDGDEGDNGTGEDGAGRGGGGGCKKTSVRKPLYVDAAVCLERIRAYIMHLFKILLKASQIIYILNLNLVQKLS